jgi:hypothetical protein
MSDFELGIKFVLGNENSRLGMRIYTAYLIKLCEHFHPGAWNSKVLEQREG